MSTGSAPCAGGFTIWPGVESRTGKAAIGPPGAFRFGSSCVSQGMSGRCGIGMLPPSGGGPGRTRFPGGVDAGVELLLVAVGEAALARRGPGCALELVADRLIGVLALVPALGSGISGP